MYNLKSSITFIKNSTMKILQKLTFSLLILIIASCTNNNSSEDFKSNSLKSSEEL